MEQQNPTFGPLSPYQEHSSEQNSSTSERVMTTDSMATGHVDTQVDASDNILATNDKISQMEDLKSDLSNGDKPRYEEITFNQNITM